jgi:hypothetical protein
MKTRHSFLFRSLTLVWITFFCFPAFSNAQKSPNYNSLQQGWESYYEANPLLKTTPGSGYKDFMRWKLFWQNRVYSTDSNRNGDFSLWKEGIHDYSLSQPDGTPGIASNWRFIGPEGIAEQCHGLVNAIYVDTVSILKTG